MDFKSTSKAIAKRLSKTPKFWDGKSVVIEMKEAEFPQWRQMEWIVLSIPMHKTIIKNNANPWPNIWEG